jgi:hypothetical protein
MKQTVKIFLKYSWVLLIAAILSGCSSKPNFMKYDVVFYAPLGTNINEVGSNIPILQQTYTNDKNFLIGDYLDVPSSIEIFGNKLYIADKYNRRVSVFPLTPGGNATNFAILPTGEGYSFGTPFQVTLNKYGEIFVLASGSNEMPSFTLQTNEDETIRTIPGKGQTNFNLYYIYKFTPDGKFVYLIGENGIHSEGMHYPERIDNDMFDNLYAYFKDYENENPNWLIKRFSPSGELGFEFNTKYISPTNTKDGNVFLGRVSDIYNLKNDERLMIYSENSILKRKDKVVETPDEFFHSIDVYSVLQNAITRNVTSSKKYLDEFISITKDDVLVLYSFDNKYSGIRFRFIEISSAINKEEVYYAPVISEHYVYIKFYVDNNGQIYSIIVKDNSYFVVLRWKKVKSRGLS